MSPAAQPAGNYYDKYRTANPIARRLMRGFLDAFDALVEQVPVSNALEIGCGEGELSMRLARRGMTVEACDIAAEAVAEAKRRAGAAQLDIAFATRPLEQARQHYAPAELVVCCEVMEHLDDPAAALDELAALSQRYLLVSVPREPLWRALNLARFHYVSDLGNTPGHVQHWSKRGFVNLLAKRFHIEAVRSPLPWTMVLCRVAP